ncbi:methyl-accepting chemotaxis protein [Paenibacillus methanolicus]|uniref:Methyl-accepting chemotaxis protein n=1 Tax=Paenibacillus methanolicus TaxID=582686 RepID=A0A5S5BQE8_9BACL|nr:HAMP domain-containing methyl-accepting chemotaxis protein [Paenibacillus methanolicus]TYP69174.1 methyl-accepting chemotaxis protein [Paenibacillus methanolicus]
MKISSWLKVMSGVFIFLTVLNGVSVYSLQQSVAQERSTVKMQAEFKQLGIDLANSSDYLTNEARAFVQFGDKVRYDNYWKEVNETKTRDHVVERLTALGAPKEELDLIAASKQNSDALVQIENAAMKAVADNDFTKARELMFDSNYEANKKIIMEPLEQFQQKMNTRAEKEADTAQQKASLMLLVTILLLIVTFGAVFAIFIIIFVKLKPLKFVNDKIAEIAQSGGDLTGRLDYAGKDEIGEISKSLNAMFETLQSIITDVRNASRSVLSSSSKLVENTIETASATAEITRRGVHIEQGATTSVQGTLDASHAIHEMSVGVQRIAVSAEDLAAIAKGTEKEAASGVNFIQQVGKQMAQISDSVSVTVEIVSNLKERSSHIGKIVSAITEISNQTNLLSLNASIEAARAGEHGRGFSVVASEIRSLAEHSSASAGQIFELLQDIMKDSQETEQAMQQVTSEVGTGQKKIEEAIESFENILKSTQQVAWQVQEVSAVSEQMAAGSEEIAASVSEMATIAEESLTGVKAVNEMTAKQSALVQEVASLTDLLGKDSRSLEALVTKFKV